MKVGRKWILVILVVYFALLNLGIISKKLMIYVKCNDYGRGKVMIV